jgi:hypothetical protein
MITVLALVAGYFLLLMALSLMVRRQRERMAVLANSLLKMELLPHQERVVQRVINTSYSMRSAPAHLLSFTIALLTPAERLDHDARQWAKENPEMVTDRRWGELFDCHMASVAAINPVFGVLMYLARFLFKMKAYVFVRRHNDCYRPSQPRLEELTVFGELKAAA